MATWRDSSGPLHVEPDLETSDRAGLGTWFGIGDFTSTPPPLRRWLDSSAKVEVSLGVFPSVWRHLWRCLQVDSFCFRLRPTIVRWYLESGSQVWTGGGYPPPPWSTARIDPTWQKFDSDHFGAKDL